MCKLINYLINLRTLSLFTECVKITERMRKERYGHTTMARKKKELKPNEFACKPNIGGLSTKYC